MKSVIALCGLVALAAAVPDHLQSVPSLLCTDPPATTVTVTAPGAPVTVTATEIIVSITVDVNGGSTSTVYSTMSSVPPATTAYAVTTPVYTTSAATASGAAQTHKVDVGAFVDSTAPGGKVFQFRPNNITAAVGDVVEFNMLGANHSVTQSAFAQPCVHIDNGFDTGFQANANNATDLIVEKFTVDASTPLWFYCRQDTPVSHCGTGMVFGINPTSNDQMEQFIAMAIAQNATTPTTSTAQPSGTSNSTTVAPTAGMRFRRNW